VVGVISGKLASAGNREDAYVAVTAVKRHEFLDSLYVARLGGFEILNSVKAGEFCIKLSAYDLVYKNIVIHNVNLFFELLLSEGFLDLLEAVLANALAVEEYDIISISAKYAGGLIFLEYDSVFVGKYFKRVLFSDIHCLSNADGEHYASQLVYFSYDSG
jgi:hypothetical protein